MVQGFSPGHCYTLQRRRRDVVLGVASPRAKLHQSTPSREAAFFARLINESRVIAAVYPLSTIHHPLAPYNLPMDDQEFRRLSDTALESLKRSLYEAEGEADFDVEDNAGALHISFEDPPGKFVISPNSPVHQIWISALSTSFKLDWSPKANDFVLTKTGEKLKPLVSRLMNEQFGEQAITLR